MRLIAIGVVLLAISPWIMQHWYPAAGAITALGGAGFFRWGLHHAWS